MNLVEIGTMLREARKAQGRTIDEINHITKISPSVLEGIENADLNEMPHSVYAKAFIMEYATLLGLEIEDLEGVLNRELDIAPMQTEININRDVADDSGWNSKVMTVLILFVLVGAVWGAYRLFEYVSRPDSASSVFDSISGSDLEEAKKDSTSQSAPHDKDFEGGELYPDQGVDADSQPEFAGNPAEDSDLESAQNSELPDDADSFGDSRSDDMADSRTEVVEESVSIVETVSEPAEDAVVSEPAATENSALTSGEQKVVTVKALADCWMRAIFDGQKKDVMLRKGREVDFTFKDQIEIKFGNAGGVQLFLNGEAYPFDARSGEVKAVQIP